MALKYCGGCNPSFDRVDYVLKIKIAAGQSIEWVILDEADFDAVLLVNGCDTECSHKTVDFCRYKQTVTVKNDGISPEEIIKILLKSEALDEDKN